MDKDGMGDAIRRVLGWVADEHHISAPPVAPAYLELEQLEAAPRWVQTNKRKPKAYESVVIGRGGRRSGIAFFGSRGWFDQEGEAIDAPSHWLDAGSPPDVDG